MQSGVILVLHLLAVIDISGATFCTYELIMAKSSGGNWAKSFYPPGIPYYWPVQG